MSVDSLIAKRNALRFRWRDARLKRLQIKEGLLSAGSGLQEVRKNRMYRNLKKEQMHLSKMIKHIDAEINRKSCARTRHTKQEADQDV